MGSRIVQYQKKIKQLLEKLIYSTYSTDTQKKLGKFLSLLETQQALTKPSLLCLPIFTEWVSCAVTVWEFNEQPPNLNIIIFTLKLVSLLMKNEKNFSFLVKDEFFGRIVNITKANRMENNPNIIVELVKILPSCLEHKAGVEFFIFHKVHEPVIRFSLTVQENFVIEESYKFLSMFLERLINYDEHFAALIVKEIMTPHNESIQQSSHASNSLVTLRDAVNCQKLEANFKLITNILEYFFENVFYFCDDCRVLVLFLKNFNEWVRPFRLLTLAENRHFGFNFCKIEFIMEFIQLYVSLMNNQISTSDAKNVIQQIMNSFLRNFYVDDFDHVQKICNFSYLYCKIVQSKISPFKISTNYELLSFAYQFLVLQSMSSFSFLIKYCYTIDELRLTKQNDFFHDFAEKIFGTTSYEIQRLIYFWRDRVSSIPNLIKLCINNLEYLKKSAKHLSKDRAVFLVQTLIYLLHGTKHSLDKNPTIARLFCDDIQCFLLSFEIIFIVIKEFDISWKDGLETFDIMPLSIEFLKSPVWPPEMMIPTLKVINVSIAKYMTPNLALLVDRTTDSAIHLLGPLIFKILHNENKEIRRIALEIARTITRISGNQFPSLQNILINSNLPNLVVQMSFSDMSASTRAEAISCLQEMVKVEEIWKTILNAREIPLKMKTVHLNSPRSIVRKEAARFISAAYEQQHFSNRDISEIYKAMATSGTKDLHWQVRIQTFNFWKKVIEHFLQEQGMIDGAFPDVTFSKEHKKIIFLTDAEVRKRLQKVLQELCDVGCLDVLVSAAKNDRAFEVSRIAVEVIHNLYKMLSFYNVTVNLQIRDGFMSNQERVSFDLEDYDQIITSHVCERNVVTPAEFIKYAQQSLGTSNIKQKRDPLRGIEDLEPLLDDLFKCFECAANTSK